MHWKSVTLPSNHFHLKIQGKEHLFLSSESCSLSVWTVYTCTLYLTYSFTITSVFRTRTGEWSASTKPHPRAYYRHQPRHFTNFSLMWLISFPLKKWGGARKSRINSFYLLFSYFFHKIPSFFLHSPLMISGVYIFNYGKNMSY